MTDIMLSIDSPDELDFLEQWLRDDPNLGDARITRAPAETRDDEMGGLSDVLMVALGAGGVGAGLAGALVVWLQTRVTEFTLKITSCDAEAGPDGGAEVKVEAEVLVRSSADVETIADSIAKVIPRGDGRP